MKMSDKEILDFVDVLIKRTENAEIEWVTELDYKLQSDLRHDVTTHIDIGDDKTAVITLIKTKTDHPISLGTNFSMEAAYTLEIVIRDKEDNELEKFSDFSTLLMPELLYKPLEKLYDEIKKSVREVEIDQTPGITSFIKNYIAHFK